MGRVSAFFGHTKAEPFLNGLERRRRMNTRRIWQGSVLAFLLTLLLALPVSALFEHAEETALAPEAQDLSFTTHRDVSFRGSMAAVSPTGEALTYRITKNPARGEITQPEDGSAQFTYRPYEGKVGKDSFVYVAEDASGHTSPPALVSIRITKAG